MSQHIKELFEKAYARNVVVYDSYAKSGEFSPALEILMQRKGVDLAGSHQILYWATSHPVVAPVRLHYEPELWNWFGEKAKKKYEDAGPGLGWAGEVAPIKFEVALAVFANGEAILGAF